MTNRKRIDVMVDLETLGTGFNAPIFQIASAGFDIKTGEIITEFNEFADIRGLTENDGLIGGGTLIWWLDTNSELLKELLDKGDLTPFGLLERYHRWLGDLALEYNDVYFWGNGILFDNAILRHKFESYGWEYPIHFRNDRDVRTIFELARHKTGKSAKEMYEEIYDRSLEAHDAFNDVINQVALVSECYRVLLEAK